MPLVSIITIVTGESLRLLGDAALAGRSLDRQVNLTNQTKTNAAEDATARKRQIRRSQRTKKMTKRRPRMMTRRRNKMIKEGKRKDANNETLPAKKMTRVQKGTRKRNNKRRRRSSVDVMIVIETAATLILIVLPTAVAAVVVLVALLIVKKRRLTRKQLEESGLWEKETLTYLLQRLRKWSKINRKFYRNNYSRCSNYRSNLE